MIGHRLRQARLAAGLTLEAVAQKMHDEGQPITRAGLSKYEQGKSTPRQTVLFTLGKVLNVRSTYFVTEPTAVIEWVAFRKQSRLSKGRQSHVRASATQIVESHLWLEATLFPNERPAFPKRQSVANVEDVENAAERLRQKWEVGQGPIDSLTKLIEDRGGVVVSFDEFGTEFDGLSGWANKTVPVVVVNGTVPDDRLRYNLGHELGHLFMDCGEVDEKDEEKLAHRFASALLIPPAVMRRELGAKRRRIAIREFGILKRKHGLSMQSLIRRAFDLEIIEASHYRKLCTDISSFGWRKQEPVKFVGDEKPSRLIQMTLRALSEGVISQDRAEQVCPAIADEPSLRGGIAEPLSPTRLRRLPREQRDRILREAAKKAEEEYRQNRKLTDFEAFSEEDQDGEDDESQ